MSDGTSTDGFPDPLSRRVQVTPDRIALVDAEDDSSWRYDELDAEVAGVAHSLAEHGLDEGNHLGLLTGTSVDAVRTIHAAWRLGLVLVPLNVRLDDTELTRQIEHADVDAVGCAPGQLERAQALTDAPTFDLSDLLVPTTGASDDGHGRSVVWTRADTALLLSTSGTTGPPKAVELTMGNLLASATASAFRLGIQPTDQLLLCLPIYHMGGLAPVLRSAHYGTGLVVRSGFDASTVAADTHDHGITGLSLVPTMLSRILDADGELAPSVRTVLLGGAPASGDLIDRCEAAGVPVHPTYGLTETASQVATALPDQAFDHPGTVGQPLLGTTVTVVDEAGDALPPGDPGELVVDGPTVAPRYYGDPEATAATFGPDGLRTGDRGYEDEERRLWVLGRLDDVIITGGEKVQPEIVAQVLRAHDGVVDAAVVGIEDPEWGERVVALLIPRGDPPTPESLRTHARRSLPGYAVPKAFAFAEELPRTASGTIDRAGVRRSFEE